MATLAGHENSCCVLGLPSGTIVTGSSGHQQNNQHVDFQLRMWRDGNVIKTMKDHMGPMGPGTKTLSEERCRETATPSVC